MQVFEIKTSKSDYPFIVIADGFRKAICVLYDNGIYDSDIISVHLLDSYKSRQILLEEKLTAKAEIEKEVRRELSMTLPQWKQMPNGAAGGDDIDKYLIRVSKGHYFTSPCIGGENYYLELDSLEQLPGLPKED